MLGSVSRIHALLVKAQNSFSIYDNGSMNGVFINWTRIPQRELTVLNDGDIIALGKGEEKENIEFGELRVFNTDFTFTYSNTSDVKPAPAAPENIVSIAGGESPAVGSKRKRASNNAEEVRSKLQAELDSLKKENAHLVSVLNRLDDAFCCPVCLELRPKNFTFHCGHTCCSACTKKLLCRTPPPNQGNAFWMPRQRGSRNTLSSLKCPLCRAEGDDFKPTRVGGRHVKVATCLALEDAITVYKDRWKKEGQTGAVASSTQASTQDGLVVDLSSQQPRMVPSYSEFVDLT